MSFAVPSLALGQRSEQTFNADHLLNAGYEDFETGNRRLSDGTIMIACLSSMQSTKAEMVRWWFADFLQTTEQYKWWHPKDHVSMAWENKQPGQIVGAYHLIEEYIAGRLQKLRIKGVEPLTFFSRDALARFKGFVLCAESGRSRFCHVVRDTDWGCEMRGRYWLGALVPEPERAAYVSKLPEWLAPGLQKHDIEEMSYLAAFLPELYRSKAARG